MRAATHCQASRRFQGAADRHQMGDAVSPKRRTGWYGDPVFGRIRRPPARRVAVFGRGEGLVACCQHQQGRCGDRHPGDARRGGVPDAVLVLWLLTLDGRRGGVDHLFELGGRAFARGRRRSFRCGAGRLPLPGLKRRSVAVRQGRRRQAISGELRNPAAVAHIAGVNDTRAGIALPPHVSHSRSGEPPDARPFLPTSHQPAQPHALGPPGAAPALPEPPGHRSRR